MDGVTGALNGAPRGAFAYSLHPQQPALYRGMGYPAEYLEIFSATRAYIRFEHDNGSVLELYRAD